MLRFRDSLVKSSYKNQIQKFSDRKKAKSLRRDLEIFESDKTRFIVIVRNLVRTLKGPTKSQGQRERWQACIKSPRLKEKVLDVLPSWTLKKVTVFFLKDLFLYLAIDTVCHSSGIIQNGT